MRRYTCAHRGGLTPTAPLRTWPLAVQIAFVYGLISCLLGTSLGTGVFRLVGYGWPLFWLALPYLLLKCNLDFQRRDVLLLVIYSLVAAWLPNAQGLRDPSPQYTLWLLGLPLLYFASARCLAKLEARPTLSTTHPPAESVGNQR